MLHEPASDVDSVLTPDLNVSCPDAHWLRELRAERILEDEFERIEAARCEFVDNKERQGTTRIVPETLVQSGGITMLPSNQCHEVMQSTCRGPAGPQ